MLREPTVLVLGLRTDRRSSLSPDPSPTPLGLRLGCVDPGAAGPPEKVHRALSEVVFLHSKVSHQSKAKSKSNMSCVIRLTEVGVSSLAVVCRGAALCLMAGRRRRCTRGGRGSGVFARSIGDGAGSDSSQTQSAARSRLVAVRLKS